MFSQIKKEFHGIAPSLYSRNVRLNSLKQYLNLLIDDFQDEILDLFEIDVVERAKHTGNKIYRDIVSDLQKMQKIPHGNKRASLIIANFKATYHNRPAMLKMLENIEISASN